MSGKKLGGDDLLIFQTPAEAFRNNVRPAGYQTPQSTGGFSQPQYSFGSRTSTFSSPGTEDKLTPQSTSSGYASNSSSNNNKPIASQNDRLRQFFDCCDFNRDGRLGEEELSHALRNYDQSEFRRSTARTMIKLFDKQHFNSVDFEDFCNIWSYLARWRAVFEKCDTNGSYCINQQEFVEALKTFGFDLPMQCINHVFLTFSTVLPNQVAVMKFDSFIESMVWIMKVTEVFKKFPNVDSNGATAEIGYFDFIDVLLAFRD